MKIVPALQHWWSARASRERRMLIWGAVVVIAYGLWVGVWRPSWSVWRDVDSQRAQTMSLLQSLQSMRAQAEYWRTQPAVTPASRDAALQSLARSAGVSLQTHAQGWRLDISDWSAEQLSQWMVDVRRVAHAHITQTQLRQEQGRWQGWMVVAVELAP